MRVSTTDPASNLALAASAVVRATGLRNSGVSGAEWTQSLESDLRSLVLKDAELSNTLRKFKWSGGGFEDTPNLEELRCALPVFIRRLSPTGMRERHLEFERCVTRFINKLTPHNARQAIEDFCNSGKWSTGSERSWRLHAFAVLLLRSFARVARYRLTFDRSMLSVQVGAVSELLLCTPGLREAIDRWIFQLLDCQRIWAPTRYAACAVHSRLSLTQDGLGVLPSTLLRRVLDFVYPECLPVQKEVARVLPPLAEPTEIAMVFSHLLWSCHVRLWKFWCPTALMVVETLLSSCSKPLHGSSKEYLHHAGIILVGLCSRLLKDPIAGMTSEAVSLARLLEAASEDAGALEGFVRHRVVCVREAAKNLEDNRAAKIQAVWRGRLVRKC